MSKPKAASLNLRTMPDHGPLSAVDVKDTRMLEPGARETPDTVNGDNPSKEYVTGSGKPGAPLGNKGRNG